jgi:TRAP-type mannitol/chloroaromatic compound transport system permease large subunit
MTVVLFLFLLFMLMGMPVAFALGISGAVFFLQEPDLPMTIPVQVVLSQTQSFLLLAIPLFILAGNLLNESGITERVMTRPFSPTHARVAQSTWCWLPAGGITSSAIAGHDVSSADRA